MNDPFYVSRVEVRKVAGVLRRAVLPGGTEVEMGVHGPIKAYYRLEDEPDRPLPVDFVVAAAAT